MAKVVLKYGDKVLGETALLKPETTIGRNAENDIHIDNLAVSSFHARIVRENDSYFIQDLGSLNGTFMKGERVELQELSPGDHVVIAKHSLVFMLEDDAPAPLQGEGAFELDRTMVLDTRQHREMAGRKPQPATLPPDSRVGVLVVEKGRAEQNEFELTDSYTAIGKAAEADMRIKGFLAPAIAAIVHLTEEGYFVSPPDSGKKPRLNGEKVTEGTLLSEGDTIEAGGVRMRFVLRNPRKAD